MKLVIIYPCALDGGLAFDPKRAARHLEGRSLAGANAIEVPPSVRDRACCDGEVIELTRIDEGITEGPLSPPATALAFAARFACEHEQVDILDPSTQVRRPLIIESGYVTETAVR